MLHLSTVDRLKRSQTYLGPTDTSHHPAKFYESSWDLDLARAQKLERFFFDSRLECWNNFWTLSYKAYSLFDLKMLEFWKLISRLSVIVPQLTGDFI